MQPIYPPQQAQGQGYPQQGQGPYPPQMGSSYPSQKVNPYRNVSANPSIYPSQQGSMYGGYGNTSQNSYPPQQGQSIYGTGQTSYPPQQSNMYGSPQQGHSSYPPQQNTLYGSPQQGHGSYPPQQSGYPLQQGQTTYPQQGSNPQQSGYPPQQGQTSYPPQQGSNPQQSGYPPQQGQTTYPQGSNPQQSGYPPQQGQTPNPQGMPPQQSGYPSQQGMPPQQSGYPPQQVQTPNPQQQGSSQQGSNTQQSGYPPQQVQTPNPQGMPPQQSGYPSQQGMPPQQSGYPPQQGQTPNPQGMPPQQSGYPPQQGQTPNPQGMPPQQSGYPSQQGMPPQQSGYPPQQGQTTYPQGSNTQQSGYPPQQVHTPNPQGMPPQQSGYPSQQGMPPQQSGYPPQQGQTPNPQGMPPQQSGYPSQQGIQQVQTSSIQLVSDDSAYSHWYLPSTRVTPLSSPGAMPIFTGLVHSDVPPTNGYHMQPSLQNTIQVIYTEDVWHKVTDTPEQILAGLFGLFGTYEVPVGLLNKLIELGTFNTLLFLIDDSGSMSASSDTVNSHGRKNTRWTEALSRLKEMLRVVSYIPVNVTIRFFNRSKTVSLTRFGMTADQFYYEATRALDKIFKKGPSGGTPAYERLAEAVNFSLGQRVSIYFFCDGEPNGGRNTRKKIKDLLIARANPSSCPVTFISCTDNDSECEWMKEVEEVAPYCGEYDDFDDERREVAIDQGTLFPYTRGFYILCSLVGALNPADLDALDESIPFTKRTLEQLLGFDLIDQDYANYFENFVQAQYRRHTRSNKDRLKKEFNWGMYYNEFLYQETPANIPAVFEFINILKHTHN